VKKILILALVLIPGVCAISFGESGTKVRINGQRVNLRSRPELNAEVVGQMAEGDVVVAKSFEGQWVEIDVPESIDVWVHGDFVSDNRVVASRLHVRGGPGINYGVLGELERGDTVTRRDEFGEWLKIAPPTGASVWVSRDYIEVLQPEKPAMPAVRTHVAEARQRQPVSSATRQPVTRASRSVVPVKPQEEAPEEAEEKPQVPPDMKLIPLPGQGKLVQREGVLRLAGFIIGRPSRYRLVRQQGNRIETICYVRGNNAQLGGFVGDRLLIRGREYWVKGVKNAVVIPEQIVPRAQ